MRRIVSLTLALCLALLLTVPAFADGRGPAFTSYDVVCAKDTPYYRENWDKDGEMEQAGILSAGTTLTVSYEYELDGVMYGNVRLAAGENEDANWGYIRVSDVELKNDEVLPQRAQKLPRTYSVRVIGKGVPMYTGPNIKYSKIQTIPRGTKLSYDYGNDIYDEFRTWAYVTYHGRSGWINVYALDRENGLAELPESEDKSQIWVLDDDVNVYSGMSFGNIEDEFDEEWGEDFIREHHEEPDRVVGTLNKDEKYTFRYSHRDDNGTWYYVSLGLLRAGWVYKMNKNNRLAVPVDSRDENRFMSIEPFELKLLDAPDPSADGTTVSIEKNTTLSAEYFSNYDYEGFYYTTIRGVSGWYSYSNANQSCALKVVSGEYDFAHDGKNDSNQAAPIYADILQKDQVIGKIPAKSAFTPLYYGTYEETNEDGNEEYVWIYYVRYNDVTGWVLESDIWSQDEEAEMSEDPEQTEETVGDDGEPAEEWDEAQTPDDAADETDAFAENTDVSQGGSGPRQIILLCVAGAVVLALTAVVTLLLIRRKRKAAQALPNETENTAGTDAE